MSGAKKKLAQKEALTQLGLTEKEKKERKEAAAKKRNTILGTIAGVVIVVLVALLLVWNSGFFARHTTALEVNGHKYSVADMDYFYHQMITQELSMYSFYQQMGQEISIPFDVNQDLKTQYVDAEKTQSYHDYFLAKAKDQVVRVTALTDAANAEGFTPDEETQKSMDSILADLRETASKNGYSSATHLLKLNYGNHINEKVYLKNVKLSMLASSYDSAAQAKATVDYSAEDMKAYYNEHSALYNSYDFDYAYFDGQPVKETDDDGNTIEPTEEQKTQAMADAKTKAEGLMSAIKDSTSEDDPATAFANAAALYNLSNTANSLVLGSRLKDNVIYDEWLMDSARKEGDIELFESEGNGYYVIQFRDSYLYDEPTVDVRHILVKAETDEGAETNEYDVPIPSQAQMDAAHDKAEELMKQFNQGDKTADAFGELAEEHSDDGRDTEGKLATSGGLYTDVHKGTMVQNFNDWIFDTSRKEGDVGLVENAGPGYYGWHVVYFQASHDPAWLTSARSARSSEDIEAWNTKLLEGYEGVEASGFSSVGSK